MPYIPETERERVLGFDTRTAGELNFLLTETCLQHIVQHGQSYAVINEIIGALEACKLEFYRRLAAPYEDTKIQQNGDVY